MRTALYYPHMAVQSKGMLRTALLTWDQLEYIVPFGEYDEPHYRDRSMAEAMELIGKSRRPTAEEQAAVHKMLAELLKQGVPEPLHYGEFADAEGYPILSRKFMYRTWEMLLRHDGVRGVAGRTVITRQSIGMLMMAMLADVMAGNSRARVTDRGLAYATIANVAALGRLGPAESKDVAQVVPLTFKTLALEHVGLERLVAFRQREAKSSGHDYRTLRHNYLKRLETHVAEAARYPSGSSDRKELDRAFEEDMEDDLRDLRDELGVAKREALLSKETVVFVLAGVAGAGMAITGAHVPPPEAFTVAGAPAAVGGLFSVANKFGAKRKEVLRKHPMAYLYEVAQP